MRLARLEPLQNPLLCFIRHCTLIFLIDQLAVLILQFGQLEIQVAVVHTQMNIPLAPTVQHLVLERISLCVVELQRLKTMGVGPREGD